MSSAEASAGVPGRLAAGPAVGMHETGEMQYVRNPCRHTDDPLPHQLQHTLNQPRHMLIILTTMSQLTTHSMPKGAGLPFICHHHRVKRPCRYRYNVMVLYRYDIRTLFTFKVLLVSIVLVILWRRAQGSVGWSVWSPDWADLIRSNSEVASLVVILSKQITHQPRHRLTLITTMP